MQTLPPPSTGFVLLYHDRYQGTVKLVRSTFSEISIHIPSMLKIVIFHLRGGVIYIIVVQYIFAHKIGIYCAD